MTDPDSSFARDLRDNFSEYPFVDLWRDRRRILADPSTALQPGALRTPPVRFALALGVVPLIVAGWLMAQLASLLVVDAAPRAPERAEVYADALRATLHDVDIAQLRERRSRYDDVPLALRDLVRTGQHSIGRLPARDTRAAADAAVRQWLAELAVAPGTDAHKQAAHARLLYEADTLAKVDAVRRDMIDSFLEGGLLADIGFVLSVLVGAHMFRRSIRRDPRFVHGARADRFYLYYFTSRVFWWTIALIPLYGARAYAYAAGEHALTDHAQAAQWLVSIGSVVYLLGHTGAMASALTGDAHVDARTKFSLGWRLVASMVLSSALTIVLLFVIVTMPILAYMIWMLG